MRKYLIILFTICCLPLQAQELTLEQVLQKSQSQEILQSAKEVEAGAIQLKIQQSKRLPLIYGDANVQRNLIVPVTPVPAIAFDPNAAPGEINPLRFATDWSAKAGLQFSMDIFNPQNHAQIQEAKINQQKAAVDVTGITVDFGNTIKDLYAQVVLAQEQEKVAVTLQNQYKQTLLIMQERHKAGRLSDVEMNNTQKKVYELEKLAEEAKVVLINKRIALLPYLDLNLQETFTTSITELLQLSQSEITTTATQNLDIDKQWNTQKIKNLNLQALPKLTLNGYYGSQFFNNEFKLFNTDYWFGSSFVNLTLRVPITETYERSLTKKQLLLESDIINSKYEASLKQDYVKQLQKENEVGLQSQKIKHEEQILALTQANVSILKAQVEEGTVLISDLNKEIENYIDQQKRVWQSQYGLLQKLVN